MSCHRPHEYIYVRKEVKNHYFLWYYDYSTYYYIFECTHCAKEKKIQVSLEQFYETWENWIAHDHTKGEYKINKLKDMVIDFRDRFKSK